MADESKAPQPSVGVVIFHGGCFVRGNATWDGALADALTEAGFYVHRATFSTTDPVQARKDCSAAVSAVRDMDGIRTVAAIGISSGGYHAWTVADEVDGVLGICPVLRPFERLRAIRDTDFFYDSVAKATRSFFSDPDTVQKFTTKPRCPSMPFSPPRTSVFP